MEKQNIIQEWYMNWPSLGSLLLTYEKKYYIICSHMHKENCYCFEYYYMAMYISLWNFIISRYNARAKYLVNYKKEKRWMDTNREHRMYHKKHATKENIIKICNKIKKLEGRKTKK
jgi:hypothetical protein